MTKHEELERFDQLVKDLGSASFLGPWLRRIRTLLKSNMDSDVIPYVTWKSETELIAKLKMERKELQQEVLLLEQLARKFRTDEEERERQYDILLTKQD